MDAAARRARVLRLVDHVRVIEATISSYLPHLLTCHAVIQRSQLRSACSDIVNRDVNPVLHGKRVVAFGKVIRAAALLSPVAKLQ